MSTSPSDHKPTFANLCSTTSTMPSDFSKADHSHVMFEFPENILKLVETHPQFTLNIFLNVFMLHCVEL